MIGNYNFTDGMHINYDNSCMNPGYPMYRSMPAPFPGYMGMPSGCPYMSGQGMNAYGAMRQECPMMYSQVQYPNSMQVYNNMYGNYIPMARGNFTAVAGQDMNDSAEMNGMPPMGCMPGMVSMRAVSISDIQD